MGTVTNNRGRLMPSIIKTTDQFFTKGPNLAVNLLNQLRSSKEKITEPVKFTDVRLIQTAFGNDVEVTVTTVNPDESIETSLQLFSPYKLFSHIKLDKPIVFFDLETTGLEGNNTRLIEISCIKLYPNGNLELWTEKINPEMLIPPRITELTKVKDEDVKGCPSFGEIAQELKDFISDSHLGGYNVINFDSRLLEKEFKRVGVDFNLKDRAIIDPMRIYHRFVPYETGKNRRLVQAYKYYCDKDLVDAHSAQPDILATMEVLISQIEKHKKEIPQDIYELSKYCFEKLPGDVDSRGKLIWRKNESGEWEVAFNYMKPELRGKTLKEVIETDMASINWILEPKEFDYPDEVKQIIRDAVNGIYPKPPALPL